MKKVGVNFIEKTICFLTEGQQGTEGVFDLDADKVKKYAPEECKTRSCLMWDFEAHTCTVCEDYCLTDEDRKKVCIITRECFKERKDLVYPCEADYNAFIKALGYEQISFRQMIAESDMPDDLKALMGLNKPF